MIKRGATDKAISAYVAETEAWKVLHDEATACLDFEELLAFGNSAFATIAHWDAIWHQKVHSQAIAYDPEEERHLVALYQLWLGPSDYLRGEIARFEKTGYEVTGAATFRLHCAEVRDLLTADNDFFGAELNGLQNEALAAHQRGETEEFQEWGD